MTKETAISVIAATMLLAKNRKSSESTISNRDQDEALDLGGKTINKESVDMAELKEKALSTVKDDLKEIALRTGVKRTRALLASKVAEFWAKKAVQRKAGESDSEFYARAEQSREGFSAFLLSDAGQSVLAYMVGFAWPMLENQIPDPKVREYGAMVAREIRIQGGTDLLDGFLTEVAFPLLNVLKEEALGFGNQATNAITEIAKAIRANSPPDATLANGRAATPAWPATKNSMCSIPCKLGSIGVKAMSKQPPAMLKSCMALVTAALRFFAAIART